MQNPFKPTAGDTPPELVGRAGLLDEFEYGLQQGSGAPGLLTIITGSKGHRQDGHVERSRTESRVGRDLPDSHARVSRPSWRRHAPPP